MLITKLIKTRFIEYIYKDYKNIPFENKKF